MSAPDEAEVTAALARHGVHLSPAQVRAILPGAAIVRRMIDAVNAPLPREAEPAVTFSAEPRK